MKALIITIFDTSQNYGNKLQNYATVKLLEKHGIKDVETYTNGNKTFGIIYLIEYIGVRLTLYKFVKHPALWKNTFYKKKIFDSFNKDYLSPVNKKINKIKNDYDYYVVGSDQVWNPEWINNDNQKIYFLEFCDRHKKITMSPSFGVDSFPDDKIGLFRDALLKFNYISVREDIGKTFVKKICGKDCDVLIDPTLALSRDEWKKIKKPPRFDCDSEKYILLNFLGGINKQVSDYIDSISNKYNLKIHNLQDGEDPAYITGPQEFIEIINKASLVMTDSFHTCVFSFLFERPFIAFQRNGRENNMQGRIVSFVKKFSLEERLFANITENNIFDIDYSEGYKILEKEREKLNEFLNVSMNNNE